MNRAARVCRRQVSAVSSRADSDFGPWERVDARDELYNE